MRQDSVAVHVVMMMTTGATTMGIMTVGITMIITKENITTKIIMKESMESAKDAMMAVETTATTVESKVKEYKELQRQIDALERKRKAMMQEILALMPEEAPSMRVANYSVRRVVRLSIGTSLADARTLGATKMREVVDRAKIKELTELGIVVPDVSELRYIQVSTLKSS